MENKCAEGLFMWRMTNNNALRSTTGILIQAELSEGGVNVSQQEAGVGRLPMGICLLDNSSSEPSKATKYKIPSNPVT